MWQPILYSYVGFCFKINEKIMSANICDSPGCMNYGRYCRRIHSPEEKTLKVDKAEKLPALIAEVQELFNTFIRLRDKGQTCISCPSKKVVHAGHYKSAGKYSGTRFDEYNTNGQCLECNNIKSGNEAEYRIGLIKKFGENEVLRLENRAQKEKLKKWSREELMALKILYTTLIKKMK